MQSTKINKSSNSISLVYAILTTRCVDNVLRLKAAEVEMMQILFSMQLLAVYLSRFATLAAKSNRYHCLAAWEGEHVLQSGQKHLEQWEQCHTQCNTIIGCPCGTGRAAFSNHRAGRFCGHLPDTASTHLRCLFHEDSYATPASLLA